MIQGLTKLAHVAIAVALLAGVVGRNLAYAESLGAQDIRAVASLIGLARRFDRMLVIPSSGLVALSGIANAWVDNLPLLGFLQGGHGNWLLVSNVLYLATMAIVGLGFVPRRRALDTQLEVALRLGAITPAVTTALQSPTFRWARRAELTLLVGIGALMTLKPL